MRFQTIFTLLSTAGLAFGGLIARQATAPDPHQPNIIKTCTTYYKVVSGDTCFGIMNRNNNFTLAEFYSWNPDVGTDCSNLLLNYYVCTNAPKPPTSTTTSLPPTSTCPPEPAPTQPGTIKCCKKFYLVVEGDSCVGIENKFKVSDADFRKWNTGIDAKCLNLFKNYNVCVGV